MSLAMSIPSDPRRLRHPQSLSDLLIYRLGRLYATAGAMTLRVCEGEFGIARREWRLLAVLGEWGEMQPSELAERVELDRARTSRALTALQAKGLIHRQVVAHDRRLARVQLTASGQALYAQLMPRVAAINTALLGGLEDAAVGQLDDLLGHLQQQAMRQMAATPWPKADRRHGRRAAGQGASPA